MYDTLRDIGRDIGLLILRWATGGLMIYGHGWGKLMTLMEGQGGSFPDPLGVGSEISLALTVFAEFLCSALLVVGFATRFAAFNLLFTMLVAAFVVHAGDPFGDKEMALVYAIPFASLLFAGAGRVSLDELVRRSLRPSQDD